MQKLRKHFWRVLLIIGILTWSFGIFYLGRHVGLEEIRKSDSGLGGLVELLGSIGLITIGFLSLAIWTLNFFSKKEN